MATSDADAAVALGAQVTAQINDKAAQIQTSAKNFAAAAGTGFHIEPEAAAILIKSCQDSIHELNDLHKHMDVIGQEPKLGTTPGAKVIAPFTQQVAIDAQGIVPAILNLIQTLTDMMQAYQKASTNYAETEALIQASLPKPPST